MDRHTMIVAICGQATAVILIVSILNAIVRSRNAGRAGRVAADDVRRLETRLVAMQESLDAVAVEVERISEGQRFTTKLLAERGEVGVGASNGVRSAGSAMPSR